MQQEAQLAKMRAKMESTSPEQPEKEKTGSQEVMKESP